MQKKLLFVIIAFLSVLSLQAQNSKVNDTLDSKRLMFEAYRFRYGINTNVNLKRAYKIYSRLARNGDTQAMNELGEMFLNGEGVNRNLKYAYNLFKRSSDEGNPKAMCNLAMMYQRGIGVRQNFSKALSQYMDAANKGSARGYYGVGYFLYKGLGTRQNYEEAEYYLKKGSEKKHAGCDFLLATYYASDYNKTPDYAKAKTFLDKAVKNGHGWTIDMTKLGALDSMKHRHASRNQLEGGKKWKERLRNEVDSELNDVQFNSLKGKWSGKVFTYDWSNSTVVNQEDITLQFEESGQFYTLNWFRNDTLCATFSPDVRNGNSWELSSLSRKQLEAPWVITKVRFGMSKDNKLCVRFRTINTKSKEPKKPCLAVLQRGGNRDSFAPVYKIVKVTPSPLHGNTVNILLQSEEDSDVSIGIFNTLGLKVADGGVRHVVKGQNSLSVTTPLKKGQYVLRISGNGSEESRIIVHL